MTFSSSANSRVAFTAFDLAQGVLVDGPRKATLVRAPGDPAHPAGCSPYLSAFSFGGGAAADLDDGPAHLAALS